MKPIFLAVSANLYLDIIGHKIIEKAIVKVL